MPATLTIAALNQMDADAFVTHLHEIFEDSPWIPAAACHARPFADLDALQLAMESAVHNASPVAQLELLRAHPQLAGKLAREGGLTSLSTREQRGAGLIDLSAREQLDVERLNGEYQEKFGFPFIIAVRGHTKNSILAQWRERLANPVDTERRAGLEEVFKIARLRLEDLLELNEDHAQGNRHMGKLSTHVLDTTAGKPAGGVRIDFSRRASGGGYRLLKTLYTNADGRTDEPLLEASAMQAGEYELLFHAGDYFIASGLSLGSPGFLDQVPVRFRVIDIRENYHVPLLVSPWSYTTYRGS